MFISRWKHLSSLLLVGLFILASSSEPVNALAIANNPSCKAVLVIFARGSGQNGSLLKSSNDEETAFYENAGIRASEGETLSFFKSLRSQLSTYQAQYVSLHDFSGKYNHYGYAALDATGSFKQKPTHRKDVSNRYYESVKDGAEELAWYLEDELSSCPLQQVVLGGYSQGAEVVGDALNIMQPAFRSRIAYTAQYGDPKFNPASSRLPLKVGWWKRGDARVNTEGLLGARTQYLPQEIVKAGSWCIKGDIICDSGPAHTQTPGNYFTSSPANDVHGNAYQNTWIPKSMAEIVKAVRERLPHVDASTDVFINKNDKLYQLDLAVVVDEDKSMDKSLAAIKGNVAGLTTELLSSYWDSRVAVVSFDTHNETNQYSRVEQPFTSDSEAVRNALFSLTPSTVSSGHARETYSGLMRAMNELSWRPGAQKKIIVITNGLPHSPSSDGWDERQVQQQAFELDPAILNVANTSCNETWTCDTAVSDAYHSLTSSSDGQVRETNLSGGNVFDLTNMLGDISLQPVASITMPTAGYVNTPFVVSADGSYDPDAAIISYRWDCNNDATWDIQTTTPNAECSYDTPYDGLMTLKVVSEDGGSATATEQIHITASQPPQGSVPATPIAHLAYSNSDATLTWDDTYGTNDVIRISDNDGNVLGYAPATAKSVKLWLGSDMEQLHVSAGNQWGWSQEASLSLDHDALEALPTSDDSSPFEVEEVAPPAAPTSSSLPDSKSPNAPLLVPSSANTAPQSTATNIMPPSNAVLAAFTDNPSPSGTSNTVTRNSIPRQAASIPLNHAASPGGKRSVILLAVLAVLLLTMLYHTRRRARF